MNDILIPPKVLQNNCNEWQNNRQRSLYGVETRDYYFYLISYQEAKKAIAATTTSGNEGMHTYISNFKTTVS